MNDSSSEQLPHAASASDQAFAEKLELTMKRVQAPAGLCDKLLQIPGLAANDSSFLRRLLPIAAVLLLAIGIGFFYQPEVNAALAQDIFGHIYLEEPYFGDGSVLSVAEVNARMESAIGEEMQPGSATDSLEVTFAKDCLIAKQRAMHLVIKGEKGPVNLMMIPAQMVEGEVRIADDQFNGLVTSASGGTLVVVGNKQEPIAQYRDRMASSLAWEY
jgi:hypothetical protein